jgi:FAD-dependent oxidoreductase domain-containing protein 1
MSPEVDPKVEDDDFEIDYNFFETYIWPALAARVSAFEGLRMTSAW